MKHSIYLTNSNQETLNKLESLGFYICPCCKFFNVKWIHFYYRTINYKDNPIKEFHGTGICEEDCEDKSLDKCIMCSIKENIRYKKDIHIFNDVDEMIEFINKNYE